MEGGQGPEDDAAGEGEVYLCPICNTQVDSTHSECPSCGAIFVDDEEGAPSEASPTEALAAEGMDIPLEYRCPACGGSVREEDETCPHCGALFVEEGDEEPPPEPEPAPGDTPVDAPAVGSPARVRPKVREPSGGETKEGDLSGLRLPADAEPVPSTPVRR